MNTGRDRADASLSPAASQAPEARRQEINSSLEPTEGTNSASALTRLLASRRRQGLWLVTLGHGSPRTHSLPVTRRTSGPTSGWGCHVEVRPAGRSRPQGLDCVWSDHRPQPRGRNECPDDQHPCLHGHEWAGALSPRAAGPLSPP